MSDRGVIVYDTFKTESVLDIPNPKVFLPYQPG